jgi:hypothetical protein
VLVLKIVSPQTSRYKVELFLLLSMIFICLLVASAAEQSSQQAFDPFVLSPALESVLSSIEIVPIVASVEQRFQNLRSMYSSNGAGVSPGFLQPQHIVAVEQHSTVATVQDVNPAAVQRNREVQALNDHHFEKVADKKSEAVIAALERAQIGYTPLPKIFYHLCKSK